MNFSLETLMFFALVILPIKFLWEIRVYKKYTAIEEWKQRKSEICDDSQPTRGA
jgi:hypothetical protein